MSLKKIASKSIALSLVGVSVTIPVMNSVSAMEFNKENKSISLIQEDIDGNINREFEPETRLGGGPSPSAMWEARGVKSGTFTKSEIKSMYSSLSNAVKSGQRTQKAFNYTNAFIGALSNKIGGLPGKIIGGFSVYLSFVDNKSTVLQRSLNVLGGAVNSGKSKVKLTVREYIRPANGAKMYEVTGWK